MPLQLLHFPAPLKQSSRYCTSDILDASTVLKTGLETCITFYPKEMYSDKLQVNLKDVLAQAMKAYVGSEGVVPFSLSLVTRWK